MARRKTKSGNKILKKSDYTNLQASDVLCPICRTILIEPVTLPCNHEFCLLCFNETMENANLVCPLCRVRVSSWVRKAKKENKFINDSLWQAIKEQFAREIQNKHHGIENGIEEVKPVIVVANPGEIRKEYEIQKHKEDQEFLKAKQLEEKASQDLIKKLREEEEYKQAVEEEKLKRDAQFAKQLALELSPSTSKATMQKKSKKCGPIDKFVKSEEALNQSVNNLSNKEYTCRVLCLDKDPKISLTKNYINQKSVMPVFQKKNQQIQKVLKKEDTTSRSKGSDSGDASDVIEMEYKYYFKPIESQKNIPIQSRLPLRISSLRPSLNTDVKIVPPSGKSQLNVKHIKSAFARFSISTPNLTSVMEGDDESSQTKSEKLQFPTLKRKCSSEGNSPHKKKSVSKLGSSIITKQIFTLKNNRNKSESPPFFYGFDKSEINSKCTCCQLMKLQFNNKANIGSTTTNVENIAKTEIPSTQKQKEMKTNIGSTTTNVANSQEIIAKTEITSNKKQKEIKTNIGTATTNVANSQEIIAKTEVSSNRKQKEIKTNVQIKINKQQTKAKTYKKGAKLKSPVLEKVKAITNCNETNKRMLQEKADYEFAKKLQAEFNSARISSSVSTRTRKGTKRQVTLDEMLMV